MIIFKIHFIIDNNQRDYVIIDIKVILFIQNHIPNLKLC